MSSKLTRQQALAKGAKAAVGLTIIGTPLWRAADAFAMPGVRRDVGAMSAKDPTLISYQKAIKAMKALPATNPLSWTYQAAIHGNLVLPPHTAWNTCEHGTYFFWSWHRMYLHYFEQIIRKMSGNPTWMLPFWNYELASERKLPAPFRISSSQLYLSNRDPLMNNGTASLSASDVDVSAGFGLTNFTSASSSIEGTPHGVVHVRVGGAMGSVPTAAVDPIFYLHHANIDRLWNLWLAQGGGRADPLSDLTWKTRKFTFFNATGAQVALTGCDVLRAAGQLNYTYQGEPPQVNSYCIRFLPPWFYARAILWQPPIPPELLVQQHVAVKVDATQFRERLLAVAANPDQTLFLQLNGVEAASQPGVVWQVYLGAPAPASFVGNLAMFGMGIHDQTKGNFMPASFSFPVDNVIRAALANGGGLSLTFVPTGPLVNGVATTPKVRSSVKIGSFSFAVETRRKR